MGSVAPKRYVSQHRLEGSLSDAPLPHLLDQLRQQLFTGSLTISSARVTGTLHLRAGVVDDAECGNDKGHEAEKKIALIREGFYEIRQRLPDLSGALGSSAALEGEVTDVPLSAVMRHCEENALTCTVVVVGGFDRGEILYRAGEIVDATLNGRRDLDLIVEVLAIEEARFRVIAPPLSLNVNGWPSVAREPTKPFRVEKHRLPAVPATVEAPLASGGIPLSLRPSVVKRIVDLLGRKK